MFLILFKGDKQCISSTCLLDLNLMDHYIYQKFQIISLKLFFVLENWLLLVTFLPSLYSILLQNSILMVIVFVFVNFKLLVTTAIVLLTGAEEAAGTTCCRARITFWFKVCNKEASWSQF